MCGRFTIRLSPQRIQEIFDVARVPEDARVRFNAAPSQSILTILHGADGREASLMRWGLIPHWAKDMKVPRPINARSETVSEKPMFKTPLKSRRCLVPADGFYEWKTERTVKRPFFIHLKEDQPFAFAGLWNSYKDGSEVVESFALMTTAPNSLMESIHDRMPVILPRDHYGLWLDPKTEVSDLLPLLTSYPASQMKAHEVSSIVNKPTNDVPQCIEPI